MLRGGLSVLALGVAVYLIALYSDGLEYLPRSGTSEPETRARSTLTPDRPPAAGDRSATPPPAVTERVREGRAGAPKAGEIVPPPDRDVTPPGVTPGPPFDGPLVRGPGRVRPLPPPPMRERRLGRVIATDAGTLAAGALTVTIAHVTAPPLDRSCTDAGGRRWPCGRVARAELRRLLRARAVVCSPPAGPPRRRFTASCRVGHIDIGLWLSQQGWARPTATAPPLYHEAAAAARRAGRGLARPHGLPQEREGP